MVRLIGPLLAVMVFSLSCASLTKTEAEDVAKKLSAIAEGQHRSEAQRARNHFRHPSETLAFFGIREDMTVVEISPGPQGWYTEILAPFLRDRGQLYAANYDSNSEIELARDFAKRFSEKLAADPSRYDKVSVTVFDPPKLLDAAPLGSVDLVLTFRNFHNWINEGSANEALEAFSRMLKPGGTLGIVQHRGDPTVEQDPIADWGYVREDFLIALVEKAGFEKVASSEVNANPKDHRDHPEGVWTLPPTYYDVKDIDREQYTAIGESDRMTLKFIKKR
jgi:predicted methyltransferase